MLILLIGGLASSGTHVLFEYGKKAGIEGGWLAQPVYTLSIPEGSLFRHEGVIGPVFAVFLATR